MIVVVTSWRGVGATTTALALATELAVERPSWLIEADPAGGVLAGRMELDSSAVAGLERVAFGPTGVDAGELFGAVAHRLGEVRVVAAPADPLRAVRCHRPRVPWQQLLRSLDDDVVVDVGRSRAGAPVSALWREADVVLVVASPEVADLVATTEWMRAAGNVAPDDEGFGDRRCLLAVVASPGGVAFPEHSVRADMGDRLAAWLAWEPTTVDLLLHGATPLDRRLRRSALCSGVRRLAEAVRTAGEVEAVTR